MNKSIHTPTIIFGISMKPSSFVQPCKRTENATRHRLK